MASLRGHGRAGDAAGFGGATLMRARLALTLLLALAALVAAACSSGGGSPAPAATTRATSAPSGGTSAAAATSAATAAAATPAAQATTAAQATAAPTAAATAAPAVTGTDYGIAGLVPAHFPSPSADDWKAFYASIPSLGGWLGAYFGYDPQQGIAASAAGQIKNASQLGFQALANIGFNHDAAGKYNASIDFSVPAQVQAYSDALAALAQSTHPPFLGIGNEVNRMWEEDHAAYDAFAKAVPGIVQAVHQASPSTKVFVVFAYEYLRGAGKISGVSRQPEWALLDQLAPAVDLVAFTTYPYFDYSSAADIPATYYQDLLAHTAGKPVGFTEIGWPSAPIAGPFGGTPESQAAFVQRLPALMKGVDPAFAMWSFAYDSTALGPTFASTGLSTNDGTAKPARAAWEQIAGGH